MLAAFRRRKRVLLTAVAGAAGVAVAYHWWKTYYGTDDIDTSTMLQMEQLLCDTAPSPPDLEPPEPVDGGGAAELDRSLDSHFNYIQDDVTPTELEKLLPRIKALLYEVTDQTSVLKLIRQRQATVTAARPAALADNSSDSAPALMTTHESMLMLATPCFSRVVAACWLVPLLDLFLRVKLNLIGRHMLLQEKLEKLRMPAINGERPRLPPKLSGAAMDTFLTCDYLADAGTRAIIAKVTEAVQMVLWELSSMKEPLGPADVSHLVSDMLAASEAPGGLPNAHSGAWAEVLMGPEGPAAMGITVHQAMSSSAEAYRRSQSSAAMVDELNRELRTVLNNYRFLEAVKAAAHYCFRTAMHHLHSTFPVPAALPVPAAVAGAAAPAVPAAVAMVITPRGSGGVAAAVAAATAAGPLRSADGSSGSGGSSGGSEVGDGGAGGSVGGASVMVPRRISSGAPPAPLSVPEDSPITQAVPIPIPSPRGLVGGSLFSSFGTLFPNNSSSIAGGGGGGGSGGLPERSPRHSMSGGTGAPAAPWSGVSGASSILPWGGVVNPGPLLMRSHSQTMAASPHSQYGASPPCQPSSSPLFRQPSLGSGGARPLGSTRSSWTGSRGSLVRQGSMGSMYLDKAPVPLPQLLKPLYDACEPLFANTKHVTKGISALPAVGALCACAFSSPPGQA